MNGITELFWTIVGSIISFFVGLILDIFLPERYRIKFQLKKKKLSKWIKNPSYTVGISSRIDLKQNIELEKFKTALMSLFSSKNPTIRGSEIHFKNSQLEYNVDVILQPAYEESEDEENEGILQVYSLNVTVSSKVKYRDLRNQIDDLRATLDYVEKSIIKNFNAYPSKRLLYVEIEYLEEFPEILENLKAEQITGTVKDSNAKFTYYGNKLTIEDTINSKTIQWLKDIIAYVG
jgi:hypothetical protein